MSFASVNGQPPDKTGQSKTCFGRRPLTFPVGHKKCEVRIGDWEKKYCHRYRKRYIILYIFVAYVYASNVSVRVFFFFEGREIEAHRCNVPGALQPPSARDAEQETLTSRQNAVSSGDIFNELRTAIYCI